MLTNLVRDLVSQVGSDSAFGKVADNPVYKETLGKVPQLRSSGLSMSFGFVNAFDSWSEGACQS